MAKKRPTSPAVLAKLKPARRRQKRYVASLHTQGNIPVGFAKAVAALEKRLKRPVWLFTQTDNDTQYGELDHRVSRLFIKNKSSIPKQPIALLIDSPGGQVRDAYRVSMVLRRRCGEYSAIVPRWAKSAATLLTLGADSILLGEDGELGPIDVQLLDLDDAETWVSGLDEVQAVEQLERAAVETAAAAMFFMQQRTGKRINRLMPDVFRFVAETTKPLFEKIDSVRFTRMSRLLSVAEQYAVRLLQPMYSEPQARAIAKDLVTRFPSHDSVIDREEAARIGKDNSGATIGLQLDLRPPPEMADIDKILDDIRAASGRFTAFGHIQESL